MEFFNHVVGLLSSHGTKRRKRWLLKKRLLVVPDPAEQAFGES
jgi:hypothetical protein